MQNRILARTLETPVGDLLAGVYEPESDPAAVALCLLEFTSRPRLQSEKHDLERQLHARFEWADDCESGEPACELLDETQSQLATYFAGARHQFDLPLRLPGTEFQQRVWNELQNIPFGQTISYDTLAKRVDSVPRAVGGANGANRVPIVVPCHRVIAKDGSLGGFGGGLHVKEKLLDHESNFHSLWQSTTLCPSEPAQRPHTPQTHVPHKGAAR